MGINPTSAKLFETLIDESSSKLLLIKAFRAAQEQSDSKTIEEVYSLLGKNDNTDTWEELFNTWQDPQLEIDKLVSEFPNQEGLSAAIVKEKKEFDKAYEIAISEIMTKAQSLALENRRHNEVLDKLSDIQTTTAVAASAATVAAAASSITAAKSVRDWLKK